MSREDRSVPTAPMGRRAFLQVAPAIVPLMAMACAGARYAPASLEGERLAVARADVGAKGALVESPGNELPIFVRGVGAPGGDQFVALSTRCMHRGCQVDPTVDRFVCPCHGSEYALSDGAVLKGPTDKPLVRFHVTTSATHIFVHLDQPLAPAGGATS